MGNDGGKTGGEVVGDGREYDMDCGKIDGEVGSVEDIGKFGGEYDSDVGGKRGGGVGSGEDVGNIGKGLRTCLVLGGGLEEVCVLEVLGRFNNGMALCFRELDLSKLMLYEELGKWSLQINLVLVR